MSEGWWIDKIKSLPLTRFSLLFQVLRINPAPNSFSLVYREKDLPRFTKYLNHRSEDQRSGLGPLYTLNVTYREGVEENTD